MVPGCDLNTMMSPTRTPKINSVHFPPLGQTEDHQQRTSPESPSQQIQHKQKQEVEKKVSLVIFNEFIIIVLIVKVKDKRLFGSGKDFSDWLK